MEAVKTVEEFVSKNEKELIIFMCSKTGIYDKNIIRDTLQEFYLKLIKSKTLETYDKDKGAFSTYICNLFCWLLAVQGKRHFRIKYKAFSVLPGRHTKHFTNEGERPTDVWDAVVPCGWAHKTRLKHPIKSICLYDAHLADTKYSRQIDAKERLENSYKHSARDLNFTSFSIDPSYRSSATSMEEELFLKIDYDNFKTYIEKTEKPDKAEQMLSFLGYRVEGCNPGDIAPMLSTSSAMVRVLKNNIKRKYEEWQSDGK